LNWGRGKFHTPDAGAPKLRVVLYSNSSAQACVIEALEARRLLAAGSAAGAEALTRAPAPEAPARHARALRNGRGDRDRDG
jgi:hypothetical protein